MDRNKILYRNVSGIKQAASFKSQIINYHKIFSFHLKKLTILFQTKGGKTGGFQPFLVNNSIKKLPIWIICLIKIIS